MGVFDPGINALSILTRVLPQPVHLLDAELEIPANRQTPIAARLQFSGGISADFDWRQQGPQTWDIELETDAGSLALRQGGAVLEIDGQASATNGPGEYPALYTRFAGLVRDGASEVDLAPMILVSDALALGRRSATDAFVWSARP